MGRFVRLGLVSQDPALDFHSTPREGETGRAGRCGPARLFPTSAPGAPHPRPRAGPAGNGVRRPGPSATHSPPPPPPTSGCRARAPPPPLRPRPPPSKRSSLGCAIRGGATHRDPDHRWLRALSFGVCSPPGTPPPGLRQASRVCGRVGVL